MNQGFQILEAIEHHEAFVDCYNAGIQSYVSKSQKSIFKSGVVTAYNILSPLDATSENVQLELENKYKNVTGIIGGPPCQDFSVGGSNKGIEGERGKLIFTYLEIVNKIKPLFIFFENVLGLYNNKEHQKGYYNLKKELQRDYHVLDGIMNALDYGIPQDRPRLTMVGFRRDVVEKLIDNEFQVSYEAAETSHRDYLFKWPEKKFKNAKGLNWPKTWAFNQGIVEDDIRAIPEKYHDLFVFSAFEGLGSNHSNQEEQFNPYSNKFKTISEGDTYRKSFKRLHRYRYSPTVAYGNNEVHLHPTEPRRLSVREALRLQSVPDTYVLPKEISLTDKFKLISNGVPTKKAELIAKEIRRTLDNYFALL